MASAPTACARATGSWVSRSPSAETAAVVEDDDGQGLVWRSRRPVDPDRNVGEVTVTDRPLFDPQVRQHFRGYLELAQPRARDLDAVGRVEGHRECVEQRLQRRIDARSGDGRLSHAVHRTPPASPVQRIPQRRQPAVHARRWPRAPHRRSRGSRAPSSRRCAPRRERRRRPATRRSGCRRRAAGRDRRRRCRRAAGRPGFRPPRRHARRRVGQVDFACVPTGERGDGLGVEDRRGGVFGERRQRRVPQRGGIPQQLERDRRSAGLITGPLRHHRGDGAAGRIPGDGHPGGVAADLGGRARRPRALRPKRLRRRRGRGARAPTGSRRTPRWRRRRRHAGGRCRRGCRGRRRRSRRRGRYSTTGGAAPFAGSVGGQ